MANATQAKIHNQLLADLPESDYQRLLPHLESVELTHGKVLYEIGDPIEYVYFPFQAMVSLVTQMEDGKIVEVGLVGNDGMTGIASLMGQAASSERALVQIPDGGARAKVAVVQQEFARGKEFQRFLLRYMNDLMRQISQTAACNASHTTEERLARWLLMCHDRVASMKLNLTQEFIAEMLGTRRATVNVAAITLQSGKLIDYNRGQITIIDRPGLEAFSCECYGLLKKGVGDGRRTEPRNN
jgi:CRP-like cAMP-binding protein